MQKHVLSAGCIVLCLMSWSNRAEAQFSVNAEFGFIQWDEFFDQNGDRQALNETQREIPIILGADYNLFGPLRAGFDLSMVHKARGNDTRFFVRELFLNVGADFDLKVVEVSAELGFKVDLEEHPVDRSPADLAVSDNQHAFYLQARALFKLLPVFDFGVRIGMVEHFARELELGGGVTRTIRGGTVVDPALLLGVGFGPVRVGVDLAYTYIDDGRSLASSLDSQWVLHMLVGVDVTLGAHRLGIKIGAPTEDFQLGIPLAGQNWNIASGVPPLSVSYTGSF